MHRVPFLAQKPRPPAASAPDSAPASAPATKAATSQADRDHPPKADYPCLTYNNVLTETVEGRPIVYLPQYGWPAMDAAAAKAWEDLGYQPVPVKGLAISSMYGGSVRCCAKVLQRKQ